VQNLRCHPLICLGLGIRVEFVILALIKVILALIKNKVPIEITWSPDIP
jgi:hypothetical protein